MQLDNGLLAALRYLVVNSNAVVAEDLRDMLMSWGAAGVDVAASLTDPWADDYGAAFVAAPLDDVLVDTRIRGLYDAGTRLVIIGPGVPDGTIDEQNFATLSEPFRSEDVADVLRRLGLWST